MSPLLLQILFFLWSVASRKVSIAHNVVSKLGHSLRRWSVIDALLDKYLAQKETQKIENAIILCNLLKTFRLI